MVAREADGADETVHGKAGRERRVWSRAFRPLGSFGAYAAVAAEHSVACSRRAAWRGSCAQSVGATDRAGTRAKRTWAAGVVSTPRRNRARSGAACACRPRPSRAGACRAKSACFEYAERRRARPSANPGRQAGTACPRAAVTGVLPTNQRPTCRSTPRRRRSAYSRSDLSLIDMSICKLRQSDATVPRRAGRPGPIRLSSRAVGIEMHARRRPSASGWLGPLCRRADLQALHRVGDRKQLRVQLARDLVLHLLHASPSVGYGYGHTDVQG